MRAIVTLEHRFISCEGKLYTSGAFDQTFWQRYLQVFSEVLIVARVKNVEKLSGKEIRVCSDKIRIYPLDHYVGLKQGLLNLPRMKRKLQYLVNHYKGAFILRIGSPIADLLGPMLKKANIPYAVEVVGDPWDVFAKGAINHPARPFLRSYFAYKLKQQCAAAKFSSYVTKNALQKRYPPMNSLKTINASSISLSEDFFAQRSDFGSENQNWIFVGTLEQYQKAPDVLIKSFKIVLEKFPNAKLNIVGDGRKRAELEGSAIKLGIENSVKFHGSVASSKEVREYLLNSPYFVLPSRGEGLPRAMIEAMACGCACVGSNIGGIRELIDDKWIAQVNDVADLAQKMIALMNLDEETKLQVSRRNNEAAKDYLVHKLDNRRMEFYSYIKKHLEEVV